MSLLVQLEIGYKDHMSMHSISTMALTEAKLAASSLLALGLQWFLELLLGP